MRPKRFPRRRSPSAEPLPAAEELPALLLQELATVAEELRVAAGLVEEASETSKAASEEGAAAAGEDGASATSEDGASAAFDFDGTEAWSLDDGALDGLPLSYLANALCRTASQASQESWVSQVSAGGRRKSHGEVEWLVASLPLPQPTVDLRQPLRQQLTHRPRDGAATLDELLRKMSSDLAETSRDLDVIQKSLLPPAAPPLKRHRTRSAVSTRAASTRQKGWREAIEETQCLAGRLMAMIRHVQTLQSHVQVLAASYDQIQIFDEALEWPATQSGRRSSLAFSDLAEIPEAQDDL
ncbi:hypothetical protein M885DRAFT_575566 [Pelagophyceae sp. CCMP2097]|nr:hypothetical protein M885DRAFT_575566 [Pelagophyceae sp. CCMP2097]